ncbi:Conserved_hypothetical protein [Hexamita inflata]|uniref:Uncharacterized protein n=1 Tax=Hexamita inflata TaxID=28002 RepID=A0AA86N606_9EUKA|nr:Conserved hypothetical protein [Hexamita inflata]
MGSYYSEYDTCVYKTKNPCQHDKSLGTMELVAAYIEIIVYSLLALFSLIRLFLKNHQIHSILIPILALVRLANYILQPLNLFANLTYIYRHIYYELPLTILLIIYSNIIFQWTKFMKKYQTILKNMLITFSLFSLALFCLSVGLYWHFDHIHNEKSKNILVSTTAIIMGLCYIALSIVNCICFYYIKPLYDLNRQMFKETKIVLMSLVIATICFIIYGVTIISESIVEIAHHNFFFLCCVEGQIYTAHWLLELLYLVVQCVPMFGLTFLGFRNFIIQK